MQVIRDTNTFVAAGFNPGSTSGKILEAIRDGKIELVWNQATRGETRRVLDQIPMLSWERFEELFRTENEYTDPIDLAAYHFVEDPDERKFAALADATATTIVTNDQHLLVHKTRLKCPVLTPAQFWERFVSSEDHS
jgi:uncharacterized protein